MISEKNGKTDAMLCFVFMSENFVVSRLRKELLWKIY